LPLERLGKLREALTINSEEYKRIILRCLEPRGYTVKASSDVESTFADAILTRKGEQRDYWLEVKDTPISLGDSDFLEQLAKYFVAYLSRTPENRFRLIIACKQIIDSDVFKKVYDDLETQTIDNIVSKMVELSNQENKNKILSSSFKEIQQFFEETVVKEADLNYWLKALERLKPTPTTKPTLSDVEYANKVIKEFGDVLPLKEEDPIFLNIFELDIPSKIYCAKTSYRDPKNIFNEKPLVFFPAFDLDNDLIWCFEEFGKDNPLIDFIKPDSIMELEVNQFFQRANAAATTVKILNRLVKSKCRKLGLKFDDRTKAHYYPKASNEDGVVAISWRAPTKESTRELTKPMMSGQKINFWIHRSATISARNFWGRFYIQIKPRFLFSPDGVTLYDGEKTDRLDRSFRKSKFSRNLNQFYDVLFWYRHVFPETYNLDNARIDVCLGFNPVQSIRILNEVKVKAEYKPNKATEEAEDLEKIDTDDPNFETLDSFLEDEE
jgi:hypothetical protein